VGKETVPAERVRLDKGTASDEVTVREEVPQESIAPDRRKPSVTPTREVHKVFIGSAGNTDGTWYRCRR
jgi:hypothetical protein